jgi:hypothetical protein
MLLKEIYENDLLQEKYSRFPTLTAPRTPSE